MVWALQSKMLSRQNLSVFSRLLLLNLKQARSSFIIFMTTKMYKIVERGGISMKKLTLEPEKKMYLTTLLASRVKEI